MNKTCWTLLEKNKEELISDILLLTPTHGCTYANTGCRQENLPGAIEDRDGWRERESWKFMLLTPLDNDDVQFRIRCN